MRKYMEEYLEARACNDETFINWGHYNDQMLLPIVQVGWHKTERGYGYGPSIRDHWLLHFIKKGRGIIRVNNMEYEATEAQIFAIRPHQIVYYEASVDDPWEYDYVGFRGKWAEQLMEDIGFGQNNYGVIQFQNLDTMFSLFMKVRAYSSSYLKEGNGIMGLCGCIYEIFQLLTEMKEKTSLISNGVQNNDFYKDKYVEMLTSLIDNSFSENISVQKLADNLHLNRSYMSELFKKNTGMSIQQYIIDRRLQYAAFMLQKSEGTIQKIALACGYEDSLYFSRAFRKKFGISPTKYREKFEIKDYKQGCLDLE